LVDNVVVLPADTRLGMAQVPIKSRCGPGGQARAQAPSWRVRPALTICQEREHALRRHELSDKPLHV